MVLMENFGHPRENDDPCVLYLWHIWLFNALYLVSFLFLIYIVESCDMEVLVVFLAFLFGLIFGSFFNVVIYRLPKGMSVVKPGSSCPKCGHRLGPLELVPVVSYLLQKGRCQSCGEPIAWRYPIVELGTGLGFACIAWQSSSGIELVVGFVYFSLLFVLALIDLDHKLLPNALTLPGIAFGLFFALLGWSIPFWSSVLGVSLGFAVMFAIALISRGGMGMGDVKLMAMIGAFLGWQKVFLCSFGPQLWGVSGESCSYI